MNDMQDLINSGVVTLGVTPVRVIADKTIFIPYFQSDTGGRWYGKRVTDGQGSGAQEACSKSDAVEVYIMPVEMEDRWLWAQYNGKYVTGGFHTETHAKECRPGFPIKLEYTKTSFPKETT